MLSSKLIAVALAVFGLGGVGVVAASTAGSPAARVDDTLGSQVARVVQSVSGVNVNDENVNDESTADAMTPFTPTVDLTTTFEVTSANKVAWDIAKFYSVTITSVVQLHDSGWGFGEIAKLYMLADKSGKTPEEIQAMRDSGMGWGNIAKALGLKPGNAGDNLGGIVSGRNVTDTETLQQSSPASPGKKKVHVNTGSKDNGNHDNGNRVNGNRDNGNQGNKGGGGKGKKP